MNGQRKTMTDSVALMQQDAAARDSISRKELRAYVFLKKFSVSPLSDDSGPRFVAEIENFGKTPAYNVRTSEHVVVDGVFVSIKDASLDGAFLSGNGNIGPGNWIERKVYEQLAPGEVEGWKKGATLYVLGRIIYTDEFSETWYSDFKVKFPSHLAESVLRGDDVSAEICTDGHNAGSWPPK